METFNHSVKVPKLYKCAAKICQEVARGVGSIKQLVYEKKHFNTKALYALVVTTFQKAEQIDLLLKRTKLFEKEPRLDPWLAKIFISELIWGKKKLPESEAKPIQTILVYEQAFKAHLSDSSIQETQQEGAGRKPRYVRVNTLLNSMNEAVDLFQDEGWILQPIDKPNDYVKFLEQISYLEGDYFMKDIHIPELLVFPAGTPFFNHPGYKEGAITLQDKASCLPVHILSPPPGSVVLDMCAAPGMKTTQTAAAINDEGTIFAVEKDPKRFEVLNKMVETSGAKCIKTFNKDVLECSNSDFPGVEYILVDPSCSGSGMVDRVVIAADQLDARLRKLSGFQIKILRSALTRYPQAKRVVYSTCSLYAEENEDVVRQVLETNNDFKLVPAGNFVKNMWRNFGSSSFGDIGKYCLYARPDEDFTNGFFVAVFERLEGEENNQFYNARAFRYMRDQNRKDERIKKRKWRREEGQGQGENPKTNVDYSQSYGESDQNKTKGEETEMIVRKHSHEEVQVVEAELKETSEEENKKRKHEEPVVDVQLKEDSGKKKKKHKHEEEAVAVVEVNEVSDKKKKKHKHEEPVVDVELNEVSGKKKKKHKHKEEAVADTEINVIKKKNKHIDEEELVVHTEVNEISEKKKKKRKTVEEEKSTDQVNTETNEACEETKKKKKKKHKNC